MTLAPEKKKRGRPRGSKNIIEKVHDKYKQFVGVEFTAVGVAKNRYRVLITRKDDAIIERLGEKKRMVISMDSLLRYLKQDGII